MYLPLSFTLEGVEYIPVFLVVEEEREDEELPLLTALLLEFLAVEELLS